MLLLQRHPEVANRPCEACIFFMYDHKTGRLERDREGKPIPRPPHSKAPCEYAKNADVETRKKACAKVSPDFGIELSERNKQAVQHYKECRAVGQFPEDDIVRRNAAIIRDLEDRHEAEQLQRTILDAMVAGRK